MVYGAYICGVQNDKTMKKFAVTFSKKTKLGYTNDLITDVDDIYQAINVLTETYDSVDIRNIVSIVLVSEA